MIRWLGLVTSCLLLTAIALLLGHTCKLICFCLSTLLLRRRMGGWHANHVWSCQLLSILASLLCVYVVGPCLERLDFLIIVLVCFASNGSAYALKPVYPPQTHFDVDVQNANNKKKKRVILLIIAVQTVSTPFLGLDVIIYCSLGFFVTILSLIAELINQKTKGGNQNGKTENCTQEDGE